MGELAMTPQLATLFAGIIEDASGLHYAGHDRELFGTKIIASAQEAGFETLLDYYYRLRYDDPDGVEMRALIQTLTVHETYFFRELRPLEQVVEGHLAHTVRRAGKARVWSAACATGEEPLTLAMLLEERGLLECVAIVASDISDAVVVRAREGRHGRRSLRDGHPVQLARRYLDATEHGVTSAKRLRDRIQFRTLNLFDEEGVETLGRFDVILMRNVLIYFRDTVIARLLERLARSLEPGGILLVGVSESLLRFGTTFACEERGGAFVYRKQQ